MPLPPTYFDLVNNERPFVIEYVEQDVATLKAMNPTPGTIGSVDGFDSQFDACVDEFEDRMLHDLPGFTGLQGGLREEARKQLRSMNHPDIVRAYAGLTIEYHAFINFILNGKKTFHYGDNLAESLTHTEINVKGSMIQLPFNSCMFVFTSPTVIDALYVIADIANRPSIDYTAPVSVFLSLLPAKTGVPGRKLMICAWHAKGPNKTLMHYKRELMLGDDWPLEDCLKTDWVELGDAREGAKPLHSDDDPLNGADIPFYTDGMRFARTVLNAVLYLSSSSPDISDTFNKHREIEARARAIKTPSKKRKLLQSRGRHSGLDYQSVGEGVGVIAISPGASEPEDPPAPASVGTVKIGSRFLVRGHWRQQPYGHQRKKRKLIWIKPHEKGPDYAQAINKPYQVM